MKKAIIACKVFYKEILDFVENNETDIEFLPQGLHDLPNNEDMKNEIQQTIDNLEQNKNYDYIILGYGFCSGGVEGLQTKNAKLVIPLVHDCLPLLLGKTNPENNLDNGGTYYLSRGWIDCGQDTYKQYLSMRDRLEDWKKEFNNYQQEEEQAKVDWHENDKYTNNRKYDEEMAQYVSYECLKSYQSITLIDNNNLAPIHYKYAKKMYNFTNNLLKQHGTEGIDYQVVEGNLELLKKLINFEQLSKEEKEDNFLVISPEEKLEMEKHILK